MGLKESLEKNTEQQKQLYREQYYANHGEYPVQDQGCLATLIVLPLTFAFRLMIWLFKGLFFTIPVFLWRQGKIGRIILAFYIAFWGIALWVQHIGPEVVGQYILNNWIYAAIILSVIVASVLLTVLFTKQEDCFLNKKVLITLPSGLVVITGVILFGLFVTKDLKDIPARNIYATLKSELNVRSGPSTDYDVIKALPVGTKVRVLEKETDGQWAKIKHNSVEGYVNLTYLEIQNPKGNAD